MRPGDTLRAESEITAVRSRPEGASGRVRRTIRGYDQRGTVVAVIDEDREVPPAALENRLLTPPRPVRYGAPPGAGTMGAAAAPGSEWRRASSHGIRQIHTRRRGTATRLSVGALAAAIDRDGPPGASAIAQDGEFDIARYADAGCTVDILLVDGERDERGLLDKEAEIEAATGIDINVTTLALGDEVAAVDQNIRADESAFDIVDVLGFFEAGAVGSGLMERLNDYVSDPTRTPADYDLEDFPPGVLGYQGYFDVENGTFGGDDLYLIPGIHSGSAILFYRQDLLDAAGIAVPTTWEEYLAAAEALTSGDVAGSAMVAAPADVTAFLVDWYTRFITMGGQMVSGSKDDGTLRINLDSPEGIAALQNMIDLVPYSPEGVTGFGFTEATDQFAIGKVAMFPTWSTIAGSLYGPDSLVADTVAVAPMPADDGNPRSIRGGWGLGIPANLPQEAKDCAWHILTQITSADVRGVPGPQLPDRPESIVDRDQPGDRRGTPVHPRGGRRARERAVPRVRGSPADVRDRRRGGTRDQPRVDRHEGRRYRHGRRPGRRRRHPRA